MARIHALREGSKSPAGAIVDVSLAQLDPAVGCICGDSQVAVVCACWGAEVGDEVVGRSRGDDVGGGVDDIRGGLGGVVGDVQGGG